MQAIECVSLSIQLHIIRPLKLLLAIQAIDKLLELIEGLRRPKFDHLGGIMPGSEVLDSGSNVGELVLHLGVGGGVVDEGESRFQGEGQVGGLEGEGAVDEAVAVGLVMRLVDVLYVNIGMKGLPAGPSTPPP